MDWVVKDKKTGEIKSLMCVSYGGSSGTRYSVAGGDGVYKEYSESGFKSKFEPVKADFSHALSVLTSLIDVNESVRRMICPLARRLHPGGYFTPGALVFFQFDGYCEESLPLDIRKDFKYGGSFRNDDARTFVILSIDDGMYGGGDDREFGRLNIAHWKGPGVDLEKYRPDFSLPICKSGYAVDAYYYLKRYDMPY